MCPPKVLWCFNPFMKEADRLAPGNITPVALIYIGANLVLFELWSGKHMYFIIKYMEKISPIK